jgi:hypothetical protein
MRKFIKLLSLCGLLAIASPAFSQVHLNINIGPPPPRREVIVVAPYPGAMWVPGYHVYSAPASGYVWVPGSWQRPPREQVVWIQPRYVRQGDHYDYYEGRWGNPGKHKGQGKHEAHGENDHGNNGHGDHGKGDHGHGDNNQ